MIIEERVERSQYVKLITWIVSFIILMAGIVFPVLILWVNQDMMSKVIGASVLCLIFFTLIFTVAYQPRKLILSETHIIMERILGQVYISYSDIIDISLYHRENVAEIRIFGIGGLGGYIGKFYNSKIGFYTAYVGDYSQAFLIKINNREKYVMSCRHAEKIVEEVKSRLKQ
ncbi:hypothetical protein GAY80_16465 [Phocaeicola vulgatus]|uniref:Bacterial Pleckstrin homology domain-containing protein n=1 Tax=Phocaeicola vulgatus TaxID=821 RepID=A0A7J5RM32_PHOVU|nr:hypothetical protein GAY80_16465 [Phocaeicola vulgatus]KAB6562936.1 hypothetical protein GAY79_04225 [Phocaeicola vulgatus]KAB6567470.1 hypothetical protein GAY82_05245 [Phocaeicola vulgatus]KAB6571951.1 hypothetical protein GAY81_03280 [Phocaeicola vulgatus]KAB6580889.1 hypothetical protein GAY84_03855 [Phocaeicola vulgatus]